MRFEYRLAAHLGRPSPSRMLSEMTSAEYTGWLAFYSHEPFGPMQDDYRAGLLATIACRAAGDKSAQPEAFFPSLGSGKPKQSSQQMAGIAKAFATTYNKALSKKRGNTPKS